MATAKRAETAQEFKEKYGKKRFTSSNAGMIVLYNYAYAAYQVNEGAKAGEIQRLFNSTVKNGGRSRYVENAITRIHTEEDLKRYNAFVHLQNWTETTFRTAVFMRNSLQSTIDNYYNIAAAIISAEEVAKALGDKADDPQVSMWLSSLMIDNFTPQKNGGGIHILRRNITLALRYLNAYNTFISIIASAVKVPEFTIFQVKMENVTRAIQILNEMLSELTSTITEHRGTEDVYLAETLKAFNPVEEEAEPIPEDNIKKSKDIISTICLKGTKTWMGAFFALYAGYWRQT